MFFLPISCITQKEHLLTIIESGKKYSTSNKDCYEHGPYSDLVHGETKWIYLDSEGSGKGCRPPVDSNPLEIVKYKMNSTTPEIICSTSTLTGSTTCEVLGDTFTY